MILEKIEIENYKGISEPVEIFFRNFNMIVGQNDAGKSTILKAIDCFLNDSSPKPDDKNNRTDHHIVSITLIFNPKEIPIIIDGNIETTFENEELINEEGWLELKKEWDVSKSQIRAETSIKRKKYNTNDFILLTEPQLIKACNDLNIPTRKGNDDEYNNTEKRQKLREYNKDRDVSFLFEFDKFPSSGASRLKEISDAIKKVLPRFEYFKADTSLSETDTTIQNFFKKLAEKTIREEIDTNEIEGNISDKIGAILEKITAKINAVVGDDEAVEPVIDFDWTKLVQTSFKSKNTEGNIRN
jgi:predicted ATP-dependent endonuclease of OLD family